MDYLVGGSLRDIIMGRPPNDYDIITSDLPPFTPKVVLGKVVKTYRYVVNGTTIDVTSDLNLTGRDFPMNAMALDDEGNFLDPRGGLEDLFRGRITIDKERLLEDPARIFRAAKLCAEMNLVPIGEAIELQVLETINQGRLYQEYLKMILSPAWKNALKVLKTFFKFPIEVPTNDLPPVTAVRTAACKANRYPTLFGLPPQLVKTCTELQTMDLTDAPRCLCTFGKTAVLAAMVQSNEEVIKLYKYWALYRHKVPKAVDSTDPQGSFLRQCMSFIKSKNDAEKVLERHDLK